MVNEPCHVTIERVDLRKNREYHLSTAIDFKQVDGSLMGFSMAGNYFDLFNVGDRVDLYMTVFTDAPTMITKIVSGDNVIEPRRVGLKG